MSIQNDIRMALAGRQAALVRLILINLAIFFLLNLASLVLNTFSDQPETFRFFYELFVLAANLSELPWRFWTIVLYGFSHMDFWHFVTNMLILYWFGRIFLEFQSGQRLVNVYILGIVAGGVLYMILYNLIPAYNANLAYLIGASAGVYGVVVATTTLAPNYRMNLFLIGPVKIIYITLALIIFWNFLSLGRGNDGGIFAHAGGMIIGYFYITRLKSGADLGKPVEIVQNFFLRLFKPQSKIKVSHRGEGAPKKAAKTSQDEIDAILDKISEKGYDSLSKEEKRKLFEASKK